MTDLSTLFELATDEIGSPDLARSSMATARRRRVRRRGAVAGLAAGVAAASVVVVPQVMGSDPDSERPSERPTPSPTPPPEEPTPVLPPIPAHAIHPAWDPATAAELPDYPIESLPTVLALEGSRSAPGDRAEPLALSRSANDKLLLQYGARAWYGLRRPGDGGDLWDSALSRDGARVAVVGEGGLFWCDAVEVCPEWERADVPARVLDEGSRIMWTQDSGRLIVASFRTAFEVDLDTGSLTELPFLGGDTAFDVAPDGRLVTRPVNSLSITEFDGTTPLRADARTPELGTRAHLASFVDAVAATRVTDEGDDGLVALERGDLSARAFLPIEGDVRGLVRPVQWLNKITVLFSVLDPGTDTVHLVTWDTHMRGNLGLVASYPASYDVSLRDLYPA